MVSETQQFGITAPLGRDPRRPSLQRFVEYSPPSAFTPVQYLDHVGTAPVLRAEVGEANLPFGRTFGATVNGLHRSEVLAGSPMGGGLNLNDFGFRHPLPEAESHIGMRLLNCVGRRLVAIAPTVSRAARPLHSSNTRRGMQVGKRVEIRTFSEHTVGTTGVFPVPAIQNQPCLFVPFFILQGGSKPGLNRVRSPRMCLGLLD